jgi:hypothetical protein
MPERPAPLVLVASAGGPTSGAGFGTYAAVANGGRALLAAELSNRLGGLGAAVAPLEPAVPPPGEPFHWGRWFTTAARPLLDEASGRGAVVDALGYAGAGALALVDDALIDDLLSPLPGEVVANNRFSADAFVVAGDLDAALGALAGCPSDNSAARALELAGFAVRDLSARAWSRFDVDTALDLALLRLASQLPASRHLDTSVSGFLAMAQLPGGRRLEVPSAERVGAVVRDRGAELVVAGRVPAAILGYLETETACRVRAFVEERGMRSAPDGVPRSLLARIADREGASGLVEHLASLGDAVILDSRLLMAVRAGSADSARWPDAEDRFASDFGDLARVRTTWLAELTEAATTADIPVLLGGHGLLSDGLRILTDAAWVGR